MAAFFTAAEHLLGRQHAVHFAQVGNTGKDAPCRSREHYDIATERLEVGRCWRVDAATIRANRGNPRSSDPRLCEVSRRAAEEVAREWEARCTCRTKETR